VAFVGKTRAQARRGNEIARTIRHREAGEDEATRFAERQLISRDDLAFAAMHDRGCR
jgi:hypothetical protein